MARIIITGVAGFIGSNLAVRLLADDHEVIGIDNLAYGVAKQIPPGVDFYKADIRDTGIYSLFAGADAVYHLAAKNCIADCQADPMETSDINVTGSVNVFQAALASGVGKVIYAESSALYEGSQELPTPETAVAPQSVYAVSKLAVKTFAESFQRFHGMRMTALRYFCVYGPRQDYRRSVPPVMSAFIIALLNGKEPTIFGNGEKRRDFIYVDDVNDFHLRCLSDQRTDGQVYNLGSGINHSIVEIYNMIAELLDSPVKADHLPDMPGEAQQTLADISRAKSLGWEPQVSLREGLRRSLDYIKSEMADGHISK